MPGGILIYLGSLVVGEPKHWWVLTFQHDSGDSNVQSLVTATGLEQWFLNLSVHRNLEVLLKHTSQNPNPDF